MRTNRASSLFLALSTLIVVLGGSIAICYSIDKNPVIYLALLWLVICIGVVFSVKANWLRLSAVYAGAVLVAVGGFEAYLAGWFSKPPRPQLINASFSNRSCVQGHPFLGYAPQKNCQTRATQYYGDKTIYDATYTIDANGWRMVPRTSPESATPVAFFGCSYTFGTGVNDHDTLPARFEEKSRGRFRALNFALGGYGPHQMLAILENALEKPALEAQPPRYAIYQALTDHVSRCTGHAFWDKSGPQYVLNAQGEPVYTGPFHDLYTRGFIRATLGSRIGRLLLSSPPSSTAADIDLYVGIVTKAAEIFHKRYGGEFYVLMWPAGWPGDEGRYGQVFAKLSANKIRVIKIEDLLPDRNADKEKYRIPIDTHPNPLAYEEIAAGLLKLF